MTARPECRNGAGALVMLVGLAAMQGAPASTQTVWPGPIRAERLSAVAPERPRELRPEPGPQESFSALVAQAARRFGLPPHWIRAVIQAESAFDPAATSPVGAMGLMQIMPDTWRDLRVRYGLGLNPYAPADNVLAGVAYLRELYDRFGPAGFLAAYNAGPGRYRDHLQTGRPLPLETRQYVARIQARLGNGFAQPTSDTGATAAPPTPDPVLKDPASAPLFVVLKPSDRESALPASTLSEGLFAPRSSAEPRQ